MNDQREQTRQAQPTHEHLPLSGVRVLEFTHMVMGPTCGMVLADLGAEVIKVEPPGGDKTRRLPGLGMGFFRAFNRNKKSIVLDITSAEGRETAAQLAQRCDVVLENFRPGLMAELGLDYATLSQRHPGLIYASHKGFLPGPYEHRTALDEIVQLMGGLSYMTGPVGRPLRAGTSVNDIMGGTWAALGVLAALLERQRTGRGQEVQSGLFENCVLLSSQHMQQFQMSGQAPLPMPARASAWSIYDTFEAAGGEQLFIGAVSDKHFFALCQVLEAPELAADPELQTNAQRVAQRPRMLASLGERLRARSVAELAPQLEAAGIPYAQVTRPDQLLKDPHLLQSGGLVPMACDDGQTGHAVLLPIQLGGRRLGVRRALPRVGEHTHEILATLSGAADQNIQPHTA